MACTSPTIETCPVCYDEVVGGEERCVNDHIVCGRCFRFLRIPRTCPTCRGNFVRRTVEDERIGCSRAIYVAAQDGDVERVRAGIAAGGCINWRNEDDGSTALIRAVERGFAEIVRVLIDNGADVEAEDVGGGSALSAGAYLGNAVIVRLLLQRGQANANHLGPRRESPLYMAVTAKHSAATDLLLSAGADPRVETADGATPLLAAAAVDFRSGVFMLLGAGVGPDEANVTGHTALMFASLSGHADMAQLLLERGANVNIKDNEGTTALMHAASRGHSEVVKRLLNRKDIDLNWTNSFGFTAVMVAALAGRDEATKLLAAERNCNLELRDKKGLTALMMAAYNGRAYTARALIAGGADVANGSSDGHTPLMLAALRDNAEAAVALLEAGAEVDQTCRSSGCTALIQAAAEGHDGVATVLLSRGADPNKCDGRGHSPLSLAASKGKTAVARVLIGYGADVNGGKVTPLMSAVVGGHADVVRLLMEHGADLSLKCAGVDVSAVAIGAGNRNVIRAIDEFSFSTTNLKRKAVNDVDRETKRMRTDRLEYLDNLAALGKECVAFVCAVYSFLSFVLAIAFYKLQVTQALTAVLAVICKVVRDNESFV